MSNTITAYFKGRTGVAESVYQNDYGIVLIFDEVELPAHFDCYFSVTGSDTALPGIGVDNRVVIPNTVLATSGKVEVHIPLHTGENDSEVEYVAYFKVIPRSRPVDDGTPEQMTAIEQAFALLQNPITNMETIVNEALSFTGETFDEMQEDLDEWKTDVESDFATLQAQYDTAVAALTVDSECADIRVGDDGVTYLSAGEAVRTQFSDIKDNITEIAQYAVPNVADADWEVGNINSSTGENASSTTTIRTKKKYLFKGNVLHTGVRKGAGETNNRASYIYMYGLKGNFISRYAFTNTTSVYHIPSNVYYLRFVYGFAIAEGKTVEGYGKENLINDWGADFNTVQTVTLSGKGQITTGDLNSYIDTGFYLIINSDVANISHLPNNKGGYLMVLRAAPTATGSVQVFFQNNGRVYSRYKTSQGFNEWTDLSEAQEYADTDLMSRIINSTLDKLYKEARVEYSTLPYENGVAGSTSYYTADEDIKGILYSSAWREGNDVYWNKTLETYYSALANPASILYTDDITDLGIYNAHAVWGGVCSSFVSYFLNLPYYTTTADLASTLVDKEMDSIYEIEVGDILLKSGHIAMISQVYTNGSGAVSSVDVSEQTLPRFKTTKVSISKLQAYLDSNGYTVKQNTFGKPRTMGNVEYASDIIFEHGNNTYVDIADAANMWFYIPSGDTVYYKKDDDESFTSVALSGVSTDTVNGVTVYNLASIFSDVGDYLLTTNTANEKKCFIKVIDVGSASISNGVLTLSGYKNCEPKQYYMVNLVSGESDKGFDPPEGYHATFPNKHHYILSDSVEIQDIPESGKYKLCIDYETGLGYKRVLSDNIGV